MNKIKVLFFGSTSDSVIVLEKLVTGKNIEIAAVVTQPPRPVGRTKTVTPTPVEVWAAQHHIAILSFPSNPERPWLYANEQQVIDALQPIQADLLVSASYGVKIPWETIKKASYGGINIHPSILPRWRGADPVPWAILSGDRQIGVTIVTLSESFDAGEILAQEKIPITPKDTSGPLRTKLFTMGADMLVRILPDFLLGKLKKTPALHLEGVKLPYAKKFSREDGFEPWEVIMKAITEGTDTDRIDRKFRALHPWPGMWTTLANSSQFTDDSKAKNKRLKLLKLHLDNKKLVLDEVQLEGKKPVVWQQFIIAYGIHI